MRLNSDHMKSKDSDRTAKQYREERRKKRAEEKTPLISSGYASPAHVSLSDSMRGGKNAKGLTEQTILEEMDSDY